MSEAGQRIKINFTSADGITAGRTTIRYQGLEVGMVKDIVLSKDLKSIYVIADIYPQATSILKKNTKFWLTKPQASITGISGLDALVSGNYIGMAPGSGEAETEFTALREPLLSLPKNEGLNIQLTAPDLGSLTVGSQIFYKKIPVGKVYAYRLADNIKSVVIDVNIKEDYAHLITEQSRFWNVSGFRADIGFNGVDIQFAGIAALIGGAIAFDSPGAGESIKSYHRYQLYPDLNTAGRGLPITIELPAGNNISPNGAPIMYKGLEIGQINRLELNKERSKVIAHAAIAPSFSDYLNSGSRFVLEEPQLSLTGVKNVKNLIAGNFISLYPGQGNKQHQFVAISQHALSAEQPGALEVTLMASQSYGLNQGNPITHKGITVGKIGSVKLKANLIEIKALIDPEYANLVKSQSKFYINSGLHSNISANGIDFTLPSMDQLLRGEVSFTSEGRNEIKALYPLFANQDLASLATSNEQGFSTLKLITSSLPSVSKGSPLLFKNLPVGEVLSYKLLKDENDDHQFEILVKVNSKYRHLVNDSTVFWLQSGIEIDASLSGIKVRTGPLATLIEGGIAFDTIDYVDNKKENHWILYDNMNQAQNFGKAITFIANKNQGLSVGSKIKYRGINVGEVTQLTPLFKQQKVQIKAQLYAKSSDLLIRTDSQYWVVTPHISIKGASNLDALISRYIEVEPGTQKSLKRNFELQTNKIEHDQGLTLVLETVDRGSLSVGSPLYFRDIEVGKVIDIELGELSDRVLLTINIKQQYQHLARANSVFWNISGIDVSVGLTSVELKTPTIDHLVRGGIAFATPDIQPLLPIAKTNTHFILNEEPKIEWLKWRTAIPKE
ncbi:MlaD family protein [Vibrio sp. SS-MA-C1-2]|nr:MlaD family protein [Vibrio sp. SS-MA-C1-2]UJF20146.1 MlaD family protein [Vibrio sp. SS-MA-C1-2]